MDVKTSFLKIKKSLDGLKQAPRKWYEKFNSHIISLGYKRSDSNSSLHTNDFPNRFFIYLVLYVDDMLMAGKDKAAISDLKQTLNKMSAMKDLGPTKHILGMRITRNRLDRTLTLS